MGNLYSEYIKEGRKKIQDDLAISNVYGVPKLKKIVVNCGVGEALENKKAIETVSTHIATITGQKPVVTHARHDISAFKLRKGEAIGIKVTLRGKRMYDFYDKLVKIVIPRFRDFRGIPVKGFDGRGSFTLGLPEQVVFTEIDYSQIDKIRGLEITIVTTGRNTAETRKLLEVLGMPFVKDKKEKQEKKK